MKIIGKNSLAELISFVLNLLLVVGSIILVTSPISLRYYTGSMFAYKVLLVLVVLTGILSLFLVYELKKIFKTLIEKNPFVYENVSSLKKMSLASILVSIAYVSKVFLLNSLMTLAVILVFAVASAFCLVLSEVFRQACIVKEENDLTI